MSPRKTSILATPATLPRVPNMPAALSFTRPGNGRGARNAKNKFSHRTHLTFSLWTPATYPISSTYKLQKRPMQAWPSGPFTDVSPTKSVILGSRNALCRAKAPDASTLSKPRARILFPRVIEHVQLKGIASIVIKHTEKRRADPRTFGV
jgi:hypothetical protein